MDSLPHEQVKHIFQYLRAFTQLKYRPRRTSEGSSLLWLHELPQDALVHNAARPKQLENTECWVILQKLKSSPPPVLPVELVPWVIGIEQNLLNNPEQPPAIQDHLVVDVVQDMDQQQSQETLLLDQQQEIIQAWEQYLSQWQDWAKQERRARALQAPYSKLFDFHQKLSTFGEKYELRLGLGYLIWKTPSGAIVKRHLLTANAQLHFDPVKGIVSVSAAGDGAKTRLEQDMLDASERIYSDISDKLIERLQEDGEDLWGEYTLPDILNTWVNAAGERGVFEMDLNPPQGVTEDPVVHWAPALILRERGQRSLLAAYDSILEQLDELSDIPDCIQRFLGTYSEESPSARAQTKPVNDFIYFPLPANDAQQQVIKRLQREQGVVVQGPPGTGKSHTIVNLVSHLLATDQKVLVTSHTARALKVLRDKFPEELTHLCISYLRGEQGAQAALRSSVKEILSRSSHRKEWEEQEQEQLLFSQLERARQKEDKLLGKLRQIRTAETGDLEFFGYLGTAQRIGEQIRKQQANFEWISELVDPQQPLNFTNQEALRLLELLNKIGAEEQAELKLGRPQEDALISVKQFVDFVRSEEEAKALTNEHDQARQHSSYLLLAELNADQLETLIQKLSKLIATIKTEQGRPISWLAEAVDALLKGQFGRWKEVLSSSQKVMPKLLERATWLEQNTPTGIEGQNIQEVKADAQAVYQHLKEGGTWGRFIFRPAVVKSRMYLRNLVKIGGRAADTPEALQDLLDYLQLSADLEQVKALWDSQGIQVSGPLKMQMTELQEHQQALAQLDQLETEFEEAQKVVQQITALAQPNWWEIEQIEQLLAASQAAKATCAARDHRQVLEDLLPVLQSLVAKGQTHSVVSEFIQAIQQRDPEAYGQGVRQLTELTKRQNLLNEQKQLLVKLSAEQPELAAHLQESADQAEWSTRLEQLETAWRWVQADQRIQELANPDFEVEVREQLADVRQTIRKTLGQLAATKAWQNTLDRLTHKEQSALQQWQYALKKLGKGTGKHAHRWRTDAQTALEEARTAIPAWIMPIHLVAENFALQRNMFDVVIIDEASQAGPEALFLSFIAKKIVIVGDDKQIEPDAVGVKIDSVDALVKTHLQGMKRALLIGDARASLFSFGGIVYPNLISLREHFRCMPEIIKFSSDLSYGAEPLIALRQFGAERLKPLVAQHLSDGYRTDKKTNPAEAQAIVDQIKACIENPKYKGKSMGVISLIGDAQAEEIAIRLRAEISEAELEERKLVCGNAYSFQGDERDVMFLSMVDSPSDDTLLRKTARDSRVFQPRYNVAVSRARDQLWLFHSVDLTQLPSDDLRASLIRHVRHPEIEGWQPLVSQEIQDLREAAARPGRGNVRPPGIFDSWFEIDVFLDIVSRGYRVIPQYELNNYRIDLVVEGLRGRLAVECDGDHWHGPEQFEKDLARQQTLERAGMEFWRVRGSTYARDPEQALEDLWNTLDKRGVYPEGDPRNFEVKTVTAEVVDTEEKKENLSVAPAESMVKTAESAAKSVARAPILTQHESGANKEAIAQAAKAAQEVISETASEVVPAVECPIQAQMQTYTAWPVQELPNSHDLSNIQTIMKVLQDIIAKEGPMTCRRTYQIYCKAAGIRMSQAIKSVLNKSMQCAIRDGSVVQEDEWGTAGLLDKIVRMPTTPAVVLRQAGPRKITELPPSEVSTLMQALLENDPSLKKENKEKLFRVVLSTYGAQRLTGNARSVLEKAYDFLFISDNHNSKQVRSTADAVY